MDINVIFWDGKNTKTKSNNNTLFNILINPTGKEYQ
jgi:hypothetical protein